MLGHPTSELFVCKLYALSCWCFSPPLTQMDLPVEATVHLSNFPNEAEVRGLLRSHGFVLTDLSRDQVRVKGSFLKLMTVKASLEQILNSQTKTDITPVPEVSTGAVSKYSNRNRSVSDGNRGRDKPPHASPSSPTNSSSWGNKRQTSPEHRASFSPTPDQRGSFRPGRESFVIDADVFRYADRLRQKDINTIVDSHNVQMDVCEVGDSFNITLLGKSARTAAFKLQSLLNDLNKSLRTQDVPLKDMDREGRALLERIQKNKDIYNLVLVCPMNDKLHLIGPSGESYELKQRLLGRPVDQSGRSGRTSDKSSRRRSSSLPPISRKNTERDNGAAGTLPPLGAAGYSPSKYQDDEQEADEPRRGRGASRFGQGGALRGRSLSRSLLKPFRRENTQVERVNVQEAENKRKPPQSPRKFLAPLQNWNKDNIKEKFKFLNRKKK